MTILFLFAFVAVVGLQSAKAQNPLRLSAGAGVNFGVRGVGQNDAAIEAVIAATLLIKGRLHVRAETAVHRFIGDKLLVVDANGNALGRNPTLFNFGAGPELFFSEQFSIAATAGLARYKWEGKQVSSGAFKLSVQSYLGARMLLVASYTVLPAFEPAVRFYGLGLGYRFR